MLRRFPARKQTGGEEMVQRGAGLLKEAFGRVVRGLARSLAIGGTGRCGRRLGADWRRRAVAWIGVGRRDMSRAGGQCHYGNAATVDGTDGGPVDGEFRRGCSAKWRVCSEPGRTDARCKRSGKNDRDSIFDFSKN